MAIARYLAMTAAEIRENPTITSKIAWMACHFSPYATGLSNRPKALPPGSVLILNDRTPICRHDAETVANQLFSCAALLQCSAVLLDFQRPQIEETEMLVSQLLKSPPCPVCVSHFYGQNTACPVFLPPVPHHIPLSEHLAPWAGREIWLELAQDAEVITVTREGAAISYLPFSDESGAVHQDESLHCHYSICLSSDSARFSLWRTPEDVEALLQEAERCGVAAAVGLWQEFAES